MFPILLLIFMVIWLGIAASAWVNDVRMLPVTYFGAVLAWCIAMAPHLKPLFN